MNEKHPFLDNAVSVNELNDREKQLLHNIDVSRGVTSAGSGSYKHKDGTHVILTKHQGGGKAGRAGLDIVLIKNDDYLHFETIADDDYKNPRLNITIGKLNSKEDGKLLYPINTFRAQEIHDTLTDKLPALAATYNKYITEDVDDMLEGIFFESQIKKRQEKAETVFMSAFNKWNEGR